MNNYPNYLIEATDYRFSKTIVDWLTNMSISQSDSTISSNYFEHIELVYLNPHQNIAYDILKSINYQKTSLITEQWLCYDANIYSIASLALKLINYRHKTKRKDVILSLATAFSITNNMSVELLDYNIPYVNVIAVNYTGPKVNFRAS